MFNLRSMPLWAMATLFLTLSPLEAGTVTLTAVRDNTLYESDQGATSNALGQHLFVGQTKNGALRRGLLAFDLSSIPSGATIQAALLTMQMSRTTAGTQVVNLHRVLADWGEGSSDAAGQEGGGVASTLGDATWLHAFFDGTLWASPGGDYVAAASASQSVSAIAPYSWGSNAGLVADVQVWLDDPSSNHGWVLVGAESVLRTTKRFDSREHPTATGRPQLQVDYVLPAAVVVSYSAGWNIVSLPLTPTQNGVQALFPDAVSAFRFDAVYQPVTVLEPCVGYWLKLGSGGDYSLTGTPIDQCSPALPASWSLVGVPQNGTRVDDISQNPAANLASVFGFAGGYTPRSGQDLLQQGQGFWFHLGTPGQVTLNSDPGSAARTVGDAGSQTQNSEAPGPALWIQSEQGRQEIRLGVEASHMTALPPLPPEGVLDARVQIGDVFSRQVPRTDGAVHYPLLVQGGKVTLRWRIPAQDSDRWVLRTAQGDVPLAGEGVQGLDTGNGSVRMVLRQTNRAPLRPEVAPNYPNPFNPATTIRYALPAAGNVSLTVFDITGQVVRRLVHGHQAGGYHLAIWDGENSAGQRVASGVFLYELRVGSFRSVQKMVLMK
jgi:hypothetical protein